MFPLNNDVNNLDPDYNYFDELQNPSTSNTQSKYYNVNEFNNNFRDYDFDKGITIFNYNVGSFKTNHENYFTMLSSLCCEPDIVVLTETWLHSDNVAGHRRYGRIRKFPHNTRQ